jgi:DNA replication and repair protein RecF
MFLKKLSLTNFKNYPEVAIVLSDKINCFIGDNGEGKTNLLDAIYYLSFCKSYFNPMDNQNIRHGEEFFAIHGTYEKNHDHLDQVSCIQKRGLKKQFRLNKKDYERFADHIGLFPLVMVSPSDADLINLGSEERRKYIDGVISQFDKFYLDDLLNYNKTLQQRNALLRQFAETRSFQQAALDIWDMQLTETGQRIHEKRKAFLEEFAPVFQSYFETISGGREKVQIDYDSHLLEGDFLAQMQQALQRDLAVRFSTIGIHKDDLLFYIGGYPVKKFGSQGQQKSFLIALKLAQFEYTRNIKTFKPILLFDDIFDKLDDHRVSQIIRLVDEDNFGQVFISETSRERIQSIFHDSNIEHKIFSINNSQANED